MEMSGKSFLSQESWVSGSALMLGICVSFGKSLHLSGPQFSPLQNGSINSCHLYFIELLKKSIIAY